MKAKNGESSDFGKLNLRFLFGKFKKAKYKQHKCILVFKNVTLDYSWKEVSPAVFLYERKVARTTVAGPVLTKKVKVKTTASPSETQEERKLKRKPDSLICFEQTSSGIICKVLSRKNCKGENREKEQGWKSFKIPEKELTPEQLNTLFARKWILIRIKPKNGTGEESEPQVKVFSGNTRKETVKNYFHYLAKEFCSWLNETKNVDFVFKALKIKY